MHMDQQAYMIGWLCGWITTMSEMEACHVFNRLCGISIFFVIVFKGLKFTWTLAG